MSSIALKIIDARLKEPQYAPQYATPGAAGIDLRACIELAIKIRPGEFVAFVGPSGAGKSSLLRLLLGFDTPEAGSILYDGVDIRSIDPEHLRSQLGVVLQSSRLIMGTIGENIRVGRPLTNDQVWEAAEAAGVAETLKSLPMGLNTPIVNDGQAISELTRSG